MIPTQTVLRDLGIQAVNAGGSTGNSCTGTTGMPAAAKRSSAARQPGYGRLRSAMPAPAATTSTPPNAPAAAPK